MVVIRVRSNGPGKWASKVSRLTVYTLQEIPAEALHLCNTLYADDQEQYGTFNYMSRMLYFIANNNFVGLTDIEIRDIYKRFKK